MNWFRAQWSGGRQGLRSLVLLAVSCSLGMGMGTRAEEPAVLVRQLPGPINTVALVNVNQLMKTPRATREGWTQLEQTSFLAGVVPIHPGMDQIIAGVDFRPTKKNQPPMSAALVATNRPLNLPKIAENLQAVSLKLQDREVLQTPSGTYLVPLREQLLGAMAASDPAPVTRWLTSFQNEEKTEEPYLTSALRSQGAQQQMLIVTDLKGLYTRADLNDFLALSALLDQDASLKEQVVRFLGGLRGIQIHINLDAQGLRLRLLLDGTNQPLFPPEAMKAFVIETLHRSGADFTDLSAAEPRNGGQSFSLTLGITDEELASLMTLVLPPVFQQVATAQTISVVPSSVQRDATVRYLQATNKILDDLKKRYPQATDYGRTALWHDTSASQIERLSVIGVDPKAVDYAQGSAKLIRSIGNSLRGVPVQNAMLQADAYLFVQQQPTMLWSPFGGLQWNPWALTPGQVNTNLPEVRARQAEVIRQDQANRAAVWQQIESKRATIVRELGSR